MAVVPFGISSAGSQHRLVSDLEATQSDSGSFESAPKESGSLTSFAGAQKGGRGDRETGSTVERIEGGSLRGRKGAGGVHSKAVLVWRRTPTPLTVSPPLY